MVSTESEPRIVALLRLASEYGQRTLFERVAAAGYRELRPAHFRLLRFPGIEGTRPKELSERLGVSKQSLNPLLNDLERWGYLQRRSDAGDRRGRTLHLTRRGRVLMQAIKRLHAQIESEWEQQLGRQCFQELRQALERMAERANSKT